jgi:peptidoglycan L-alanyl-D-glutamate endopeptidase CwlK
MNRLGYKSRRELIGVHPDLIIVVVTAIINLPKGLDATVFDGLRTLPEQRENIRRGVSKTLKSKHLPQSDGYGHAVDIVPIINGRVMWDSKDAVTQKLIDTAFEDISYQMWAAGDLHDIEIESGYKLWGWDKPHYQLGKSYR